MKKILFSILSLGVVAVVAIGATRAYFSSTEQILGNNIQTAFLEIKWDEDPDSRYYRLNFPINDIAPGETTDWVDAEGEEHKQGARFLVTEGSLVPDHYELKFSTTNFRDGQNLGYGSYSTQDQFTKAMKLTSLVNRGSFGWTSLLGDVVDIDRDGKKTLYDLERQVIDNLQVGKDSNGNEFIFQFTMFPDAGNEFQRDSLNLNIEVGAAQVAGQSVLSVQ